MNRDPDEDLEEEEDWLENPVMGAEELLRFSRVRQLLQVIGAMAKREAKSRPGKSHPEEIIVDAYGPEEQAMGWYYYLEDKIRFPFHAKCIASVPTSPLRKGESVEIRRYGA